MDKQFPATPSAEELQALLEDAKRWRGLRPVLQKFVLGMERELRANDHKGGWENEHLDDLMWRIEEELSEFREAMSQRCFGPDPKVRRRAVVEEAVDVANMIMMAVDVAVGWDHD